MHQLSSAPLQELHTATGMARSKLANKSSNANKLFGLGGYKPPNYAPLSTNMSGAVQALTRGATSYGIGADTCLYRLCDGIQLASNAVQNAQASFGTTFVKRPAKRPANWLGVAGQALFRSVDGSNFELWHGRGVNILDPNVCVAASDSQHQVSLAEGVAIAIQKIDVAVSIGVNFIRMPLDATAIDGSNQSRITNDPAYMASIDHIVDHVGNFSGVYLLLSLWMDPTGEQPKAPSAWVPTEATIPSWTEIARHNANKPQVLFGLFNEPANSQEQLASIADIVKGGIAAMRGVEGSTPHVISVSGLYTGNDSRQYGRDLSFWEANPLNDADVVYELHPYNTFSEAKGLFSSSLPVLIGEFGPLPAPNDSNPTTLGDMVAIMGYAEEINPMPYAAWQLGSDCEPNLIGQGDYSVIVASWICQIQLQDVGNSVFCSPQVFNQSGDSTNISVSSFPVNALIHRIQNAEVCQGL
ncbi:TPA: hypothetical protein ACH3X2_003211 [Trebouxia sp. C0005]